MNDFIGAIKSPSKERGRKSKRRTSLFVLYFQTVGKRKNEYRKIPLRYSLLTPGFTAGRMAHFWLLKFIILLDKKVVVYFYARKLRPFLFSGRCFVNIVYVCALQGEQKRRVSGNNKLTSVISHRVFNKIL